MGSIFHISKIDTNFNINTPDLENQYKYQYQYLSFKNSITIPIPILKILQFNLNLGLKTKVLQYSELGIGRAAPLASPIRFDPLGFIHGPYTFPRGNPIDP